jgi:nucleotide-binding universal stress UspA family protein
VQIVVGVDGSDEARRALLWACSEAQVHAAPVLVVHVWHYPYGIAPAAATATREELRASFKRDAEEVLAKEVTTARETGAEVSSMLLEGSPTDQLVRAAQPGDLLVVGSHGRGGFTGLLLGSVGQQCAHHARCPIVIVPSHPR